MLYAVIENRWTIFGWGRSWTAARLRKRWIWAPLSNGIALLFGACVIFNRYNLTRTFHKEPFAEILGPFLKGFLVHFPDKNRSQKQQNLDSFSEQNFDRFWFQKLSENLDKCMQKGRLYGTLFVDRFCSQNFMLQQRQRKITASKTLGRLFNNRLRVCCKFC